MNHDQPVQSLKDEHQVILRVIKVLGRLVDRVEQQGEFEVAAFGQCVTFFRLFADACHHGKEEDLLFPVLEARGIPREGGPIGVMLFEHQVARQLTKEMGDALARVRAGEIESKKPLIEAARNYINLLTNHIFKEDNILFNMGARVMNTGDQDDLSNKFCAVNCRVFEGKRREQLLGIADKLEAECER